MVVNTDLDCLIYRSGWGSKGDFIQSLELLEGFLHSISDKTNCSETNLILSGATNFRKEIDPNYKANRKESARPRHYKALREYAVEWLGAYLTDGVEADDELGKLQGEGACIASADKDMLQVPGYHYRFKKDWKDNEIIFIDEDEAWLNFFKQCLTGDAVDCVEGVKNPAKSHHKNPPNFSDDAADKLLRGLSKSEQLMNVHDMYKSQYGDGWWERFDRNARLLFIQRKDAKEYYDALADVFFDR